MYLIIFVVSCLIGVLIQWRIRKMSVLSRNGIPGPKPNLIYGNMLEIQRKAMPLRHKEWIPKYGKVFGYYFGQKPQIVVADPELIKNIQIKDFHIFTDRPHFSIKHGIIPIPEMTTSITRSEGQRWKEIRAVLTPTFSAAKLKTMTPIMDDTINTLIELIDDKVKNDEEFNIYDMFQALTSDVIGRTAFGIQTNVQKDPNDKFLEASRAFFNLNLNQFMIVLLMCFPQIDVILYPYRRLKQIIKEYSGTSHTGYLMNMCNEIIHLRRKNPNYKRKDLLQLMLDARMSNDDMIKMSSDQLTVGDDDNQSESINKSSINSESKLFKRDRYLTDEEIKANSVIFFEAGYETTSTVLGFVAHILVNYPEIQEKMRDEVKELYTNEGKLDYNTVTQLKYMEMVINETMRMYTPVTGFVTRHVLQDYKYGDMTIPKGSTIQIPTHYLHHDPDLWEDPETFDPNRFSPENKSRIHPSAFQAFGNGPRNCIGMRFALLEAKLALSKLLMKFRFEKGPKTEIGNINTDFKFITQTPKNGVYVKAVKL